MRQRFRLGGIVVLAGLLAGAGVVTSAKPKPKVDKLPNDDRAITHVLNRIGFGPAPGDVKRIGQMGLEQYIDQQLHPEKLPDPGMRERVAGFTTLNLSSEQIATRYYQPLVQERRELQREGFSKNAKKDQAQAQRREPKTCSLPRDRLAWSPRRLFHLMKPPPLAHQRWRSR